MCRLITFNKGNPFVFHGLIYFRVMYWFPGKNVSLHVTYWSTLTKTMYLTPVCVIGSGLLAFDPVHSAQKLLWNHNNPYRLIREILFWMFYWPVGPLKSDGLWILNPKWQRKDVTRFGGVGGLSWVRSISRYFRLLTIIHDSPFESDR